MEELLKKNLPFCEEMLTLYENCRRINELKKPELAKILLERVRLCERVIEMHHTPKLQDLPATVA
ncbi:MAG: hypothetical protein ACQESA_03365 [Patescibacteria group bacterium]